ncbi:MAG: hypothetical protein WCI22_14805 [Actinomycetota bacterium]
MSNHENTVNRTIDGDSAEGHLKLHVTDEPEVSHRQFDDDATGHGTERHAALDDDAEGHAAEGHAAEGRAAERRAAERHGTEINRHI